MKIAFIFSRQNKLMHNNDNSDILNYKLSFKTLYNHYLCDKNI